MAELTNMFNRIVSEAMDVKTLSQFGDMYSQLLNRFDAVTETFESAYVYDEAQEAIVAQIAKAREEQAKLVKMLNKKYTRR